MQSLPPRRFTRLLCSLLILPLAGCTTHKGAESGPNGGPAASSENVPSTNALRYALTTEPTDLDPARVEDGTTIDLLQQIYEGLVKWDENNKAVGGIAEKWDVSADGKTYTFHLRKGVKFHNGREVTADDFKYSLERSCDDKTHSSTASTYLKDIVGAQDMFDKKASSLAGVKVVDPYTLQITIDSVRPYWIYNMTYPTGYAVCKEAIEKNGGKIDENSSIGTGPFKLRSFKRGVQVVLAANPDYYLGRPKLDYIVRPIIKDATTRLNNYEAGELDILADVSPRDLDQINSNPKLKDDLKSFPRAATWYLGLNQAAAGSPFAKLEVRQAFAMAVDKKEIIRVALKGQADLAGAVCPPGMPNYAPKLTAPPFDPVKAKQLLAQAGYPDGKGFPTLTFSFRNDYPHVADAAQIVAQQLKQNLGIEVQLRPMEWAQFLVERNNKTMPLTLQRWAADYLDPQNFLSVLLHTSRVVNGKEDHPENGLGYNNPQFDMLTEQADVERDVKKRMAEYAQAEQIALTDAPWVPVYFQRDLELDKPRVKNIRDSLFGHLPHTMTTVN